MSEIGFLSHPRRKIAFEEITLREAEKIIRRSKTQKIRDIAKEYGVAIATPNVVAGAVGYAIGGREGALESMRQVSLGILPYSLGLLTWAELKKRKQPLDDINYVVKELRQTMSASIALADHTIATGATMLSYAALSGSMYLGFSWLGQHATHVNMNRPIMFATGTVAALGAGAYGQIKVKQWRQKIADFVANEPELMAEKRGTLLERKDLDALVDYAVSNTDKVRKIALASSEKSYRGLSGAFSFFGAVDALGDKYRDPSRLRPNIVVNAKSGDWTGEGSYVEFTFDVPRADTKTNTILEVAKLANAKANGVKVDIHPMFENTSLDSLLHEPYEQLSAVYIRGEVGKTEEFEVRYEFHSDGNDEVTVKLQNPSYLDLVPDIFRQISGRSIEDRDFDAELLQSSRQSIIVVQDAAQYIARLTGKASKKPKRGNSADRRSTPLSDESSDSIDKTKTHEQETSELPVRNLEDLPKVVLAAYAQNKENIMPTQGFPSLNVAFEGVVYSLSPAKEEKKDKKHLALHCLFHPLQSTKAIMTERELLPSIREAEVMAQIPGITPERVYDIVRRLEKNAPGITVSPSVKSISYDDFWNVKQNPKILSQLCSDFDLHDRKGAKITLSFSTPEYSYKTLRDTSFPPEEVVRAKAAEANAARERHDFNALGIWGMLGKTRFEKELEHKSYALVPAKENLPEHIILYNDDDNAVFVRNRTVKITTTRPFFDTPVHPREALNRITRYLTIIRDAALEKQ
jgi:hypothetical protein